MKLIFAFLLIFSLNFSFSQSEIELGIMPNINFNYEIKKDWALTFKAETRVYNEVAFGLHRTDLWLALSKKISHQSKVRIGYQVLVDNNQRHRFNQQFIHVKKYSKLKLAQRLAFDQTLGKNNPVFRCRYRYAEEIPLTGQNLDSKEYYIKLNQEILFILQEKKLSNELRLGAHIGKQTTPRNKIEIGFDFRSTLFNRNKLWTTLSWYKNIN